MYILQRTYSVRLVSKHPARSFCLILGLWICLSGTYSCQSPPVSSTKAEAPLAEEANTSSLESHHMIGELAPDFQLSDLSGNPLQLSAMRGKIVAIHFATTWCPFCNAEAPHLEALYQAYKEQGVQVLIVDVKEDQELVQTKLQDRFQLSFPVLLDPDGAVAASYAPEGVLPDLSRDEVVLASNLLIDREGKIQFYSLLDSQNFDAELLALQSRLDAIL